MMSAGEADRLAAQAARHHRAGRAAEAERLYRAALALAPGQAVSLHGLGCLAHEAGRPDVAIGLIGQAVAAAPAVAHYTLSLGLALLDRGHGEEARAALHVATLREPGNPHAHRGLAQAFSRLGRLGEAESSLRTALRLDPANPAALLSLGQVLRARGDAAAATTAFREAARLAPDDPLAWHALASAHGAVGASVEAEAAFRRVAALLPGDAAAQANLGTALFALDRLQEARACLLRARALAPQAAPENPVTLSSLGLVLMGLGDSVEAERVLARATSVAPENDAIAVNHGTALAALERRDEAEAVFARVLSHETSPMLSHETSSAEARFNLATMLLARGELNRGWAGFEARLGLVASRPVAGLPDWDGSRLDDGQVLIRAEQGLGDTIQFLRWIGPAAARARLVLELPPAMLRLVRGSGLFDPARVHLRAAGDGGVAAAACVAQASLLSLPHLLRLAGVPPMTMLPGPARVPSMPEHRPPGLRVGLSWAGSAAYRFDRQRSLRLDQLAPLAAAAGVRFVSLQQGPAAAQALEPPAGMALAMPEAPFEDLAETAALIASLDLVISVDTAIVHLAGALGRPVWLLDRFGGDWRWQPGFASGRDWYPTLRRFAQERPVAGPDAWNDVIAELAGALAELAIGSGKPAQPPA